MIDLRSIFYVVHSNNYSILGFPVLLFYLTNPACVPIEGLTHHIIFFYFK